MKSRSNVLAILILFISCGMYAENPKNKDMDVGLDFEYISGYSQYDIDILNTAQSRLKWPINTFVAGPRFQFQTGKDSFLSFSYKTNVNRDAGDLEDSDWLYHDLIAFGKCKTTISANIYDIEYSKRMKLDNLPVGLGIGYKGMHLDWMASGNLYQSIYGASGAAMFGIPSGSYVFESKNWISYKIDYQMPYVKANAIINIGGLDVDTFVKLISISAEDLDDHLDRFKTAKGKLSGTGYELGGETKLDLNNNMHANLFFKYMKLSASGSQNQNYYSGSMAGTQVNDISETISFSQLNIGASLVYMFGSVRNISNLKDGQKIIVQRPAINIPKYRYGLESGMDFSGFDVTDFSTSKDSFLKRVNSYSLALTTYTPQATVDKGSTNYGIKAFVEKVYSDNWIIGASLGYGLVPVSTLEQIYRRTSIGSSSNYNRKFEYSGTVIPVAFYAKKMICDNKAAIMAGAGINYYNINMKYTGSSLTDYANSATTDIWYRYSWESNKSIIVPLLTAKTEYFVSKNISVGADIFYLFSSVADNFSGYYSMSTNASVTNYSGNGTLIMRDDGYGYEMNVSNYPAIPTTKAERPFNINLGGLKADIALRYYFK